MQNEIFEGVDFSLQLPKRNDYENCLFRQCHFSNTDLSGFRFVDCEFAGCDLSLAKLTKATFNDVRFVNCKMLGLHLEDCNDFLFSTYFENCTLNFSSFYKRNLKKTKFKNCVLQEVDFTDADLTEASFENCDLAKAVFENTTLEKADFRTAFNYSIDPEINKIRKAKFDRTGISGLLDKYNILIS